jgi:hypothetical protein
VRLWSGPDDGVVSALAEVSIATLAPSGWASQTRIERHRSDTLRRGLDQIDSDHGTWAAGPSGCSVLPRTTLSPTSGPMV